jgi:hypothetical protein
VESEAHGSAARRTQGEWGVSVLPDGRGAMVVTPPPGEMWRRVREGDLPVTSLRVALCESSHYVPHDAAVANARLIAAAPALVDACEAALETLDHAEVNRWEQEVADRLRAALALAKGESSP